MVGSELIHPVYMREVFEFIEVGYDLGKTARIEAIRQPIHDGEQRVVTPGTSISIV